MGNLYQIRDRVVISSIKGDLPTNSYVCLPVSCIVFGVEGTFSISTENAESDNGNCFYVEADVTYKINPFDCNGFVIVFFDAVSPEHYFLSKKYSGLKTVKLSEEVDEKLLSRTFEKMNEVESDIFLDKIFSKLFSIERREISHKHDSRIVLVDEYIRRNIREKISNKELAEKVHLSESRFYHFFKEQTQVNVSRYILWLRLKTIFESYFRSKSKLNTLLDLTNFTDLSHLIKSFKSFFGESPKKLLKK